MYICMYTKPCPPHQDGSVLLWAEGVASRVTPYYDPDNSLRVRCYRGTSLIRNVLLLAPYSRPMPRALRWSYGGRGSSF